MIPICERCGVEPAKPGDWMHCEECYQIVCNEIHEVECELRERAERPGMITIKIPPHPDDPDRDANDEIARLMATQGLTFIEAVEEILVERWGLEWLRSQQARPDTAWPHPDEFWP